jgi:hypothetical protein
MIETNGVLYIFSGRGGGGYRISRYYGGRAVQTIAVINDGTPPFQGAVCAQGSRINFGSYTTYPLNSASVFTYGSKTAQIAGAFHNTAITSSSGATPIVTAIADVQLDSMQDPKIVIAWKDDSGRGIDKSSNSSTYKSVWRSQKYNLGDKFRIKTIRFHLAQKLLANMEITPKIIYDDGDVTQSLLPINTTNYPSAKRSIEYKWLVGSAVQNQGEVNFQLELNFSGTVECSVTFPIFIEYEYVRN